MKKLGYLFYGWIPVCSLILLQTYEVLEEKRNMNYEVTMTHYLCFLILGALICLGVLSSAHMERKCVLVKQNCNTSVTFLSDLRRRKPIVCCVRSLIVVPTICISGYFRI